MVFIAQIYTPLDYDRSLYIFACNKRSCSLLSEGWIVFRNQHIPNVSSLPLNAPASVSISSVQVTKPNESVWNFLSDSSINEPEIDLEELLAQRDESLTKKKESPIQEGGGSSNSSSEPSKNETFSNSSSSSLSCFYIEEVEDSWQSKKAVAVCDGSHINELLRSYLGEEEDEKVKEMVRSASASKGTKKLETISGSAMEEGEEIDEGDGDEDDDGNEDDDDDEEEEEENDRDGEEDESGTTKTTRKVELYFQQRVQSQPRQVLRYAFEGRPLWITHPNPVGSDPFFGQESKPTLIQQTPPKQSKRLGHGSSSATKAAVAVPCCELCGAQRVFELQLMPALLSHLHLPPPPLPASSSNATALEQLLGDGLDFGVVAVYSCPHSCSPAGNIAHEVAVVQPPPDLT